jgi:hypothetical protein
MLTQPDFSQNNKELGATFEIVVHNGARYEDFGDAFMFGAHLKIAEARNFAELYTAMNSAVFTCVALDQPHLNFTLFNAGEITELGPLEPHDMNRFAKDINSFIAFIESHLKSQS